MTIPALALTQFERSLEKDYPCTCSARKVRKPRIREAKMNHPNHSRSAISLNEKSPICTKEIRAVVTVNISMPGRIARTPSHFFCRANNRLPNPYDKSGPAYICARTGVTFQGQSVDMNAGAENSRTDSNEKRMP